MTRRPDAGAQAAQAGFYHGTYEIRNTGGNVIEHGLVMALVSADGQVLFNASSEGLEGAPAQGGGKGTLVGTKFTANAGGAAINGTIDPATHVITATFRTEDGNGSLNIHREYGTAIIGFAGVAPDQSGFSLLVESPAGGPPAPPIMMPSLARDEHSVATAISNSTLSGTIKDALPVEAPLIVITEVGDSFTIGFATQIGVTYTVQVSEVLTNWTDLITFTAQTEGYEVADPNGGAARFYRVIVR